MFRLGKKKLSKKQKIITIIIVLLLAIASIYIYYDNFIIFTAKDCLPFAKEVATDWKDDAELVNVGNYKGYQSGGKCSDWYFTFISTSSNYTEDNVTLFMSLNIHIKYNRNHEIHTEHYTIDLIGNPIKNWKIDSDEALKIALENDKIDSYRSSHIEDEPGFFLSMNDIYSNDHPTWSIGFSADGVMDSPSGIHIYINAYNGDVLYAGYNG